MNLTTARKEKGLNQKQLAEITLISPVTVHNIESGKTQATRFVKMRIEQTIGKNIDWKQPLTNK